MVTRIPSVLIKTAAKQVESAGKKLVQLTRGTSTSSMVTDHSGRSDNNTQQGGSDATSSNSNQPTTLPAIGSGSGDEDSYHLESLSGDTPDSSSHGGDKKSKKHRGSNRRRKLFSSIFRRGHGHGHESQSQSARELTTKNTC